MVDREFGRIQPAPLPPYATETTDSAKAKEYKYLLLVGSYSFISKNDIREQIDL